MTTYAAVTLLLGAHMVPHSAQAIALRRVVPGLVGGLTLSLPYSALVVGRLLRHGLVEPCALARATGAGAGLLVPVLLGCEPSAGRWRSCRNRVAVRLLGDLTALGPTRRSSASSPSYQLWSGWLVVFAVLLWRPPIPEAGRPALDLSGG
jgi:hypothetical protein